MALPRHAEGSTSSSSTTRQIDESRQPLLQADQHRPTILRTDSAADLAAQDGSTVVRASGGFTIKARAGEQITVESQTPHGTKTKVTVGTPPSSNLQSVAESKSKKQKRKKGSKDAGTGAGAAAITKSLSRPSSPTAAGTREFAADPMSSADYVAKVEPSADTPIDAFLKGLSQQPENSDSTGLRAPLLAPGDAKSDAPGDSSVHYAAKAVVPYNQSMRKNPQAEEKSSCNSYTFWSYFLGSIAACQPASNVLTASAFLCYFIATADVEFSKSETSLGEVLLHNVQHNGYWGAMAPLTAFSLYANLRAARNIVPDLINRSRQIGELVRDLFTGKLKCSWMTVLDVYGLFSGLGAGISQGYITKDSYNSLPSADIWWQSAKFYPTAISVPLVGTLTGTSRCIGFAQTLDRFPALYDKNDRTLVRLLNGLKTTAAARIKLKDDFIAELKSSAEKKSSSDTSVTRHSTSEEKQKATNLVNLLSDLFDQSKLHGEKLKLSNEDKQQLQSLLEEMMILETFFVQTKSCSNCSIGKAIKWFFAIATAIAALILFLEKLIPLVPNNYEENSDGHMAMEIVRVFLGAFFSGSSGVLYLLAGLELPELLTKLWSYNPIITLIESFINAGTGLSLFAPALQLPYNKPSIPLPTIEVPHGWLLPIAVSVGASEINTRYCAREHLKAIESKERNATLKTRAEAKTLPEKAQAVQEAEQLEKTVESLNQMIKVIRSQRKQDNYSLVERIKTNIRQTLFGSSEQKSDAGDSKQEATQTSSWKNCFSRCRSGSA